MITEIIFIITTLTILFSQYVILKIEQYNKIIEDELNNLQNKDENKDENDDEVDDEVDEVDDNEVDDNDNDDNDDEDYDDYDDDDDY